MRNHLHWLFPSEKHDFVWGFVFFLEVVWFYIINWQLGPWDQAPSLEQVRADLAERAEGFMRACTWAGIGRGWYSHKPYETGDSRLL